MRKNNFSKVAALATVATVPAVSFGSPVAFAQENTNTVLSDACTANDKRQASEETVVGAIANFAGGAKDVVMVPLGFAYKVISNPTVLTVVKGAVSIADATNAWDNPQVSATLKQFNLTPEQAKFMANDFTSFLENMQPNKLIEQDSRFQRQIYDVFRSFNVPDDQTAIGIDLINGFGGMNVFLEWLQGEEQANGDVVMNWGRLGAAIQNTSLETEQVAQILDEMVVNGPFKNIVNDQVKADIDEALTGNKGTVTVDFATDVFLSECKGEGGKSTTKAATPTAGDNSGSTNKPATSAKPKPSTSKPAPKTTEKKPAPTTSAKPSTSKPAPKTTEKKPAPTTSAKPADNKPKPSTSKPAPKTTEKTPSEEEIRRPKPATSSGADTRTRVIRSIGIEDLRHPATQFSSQKAALVGANSLLEQGQFSTNEDFSVAVNNLAHAIESGDEALMTESLGYISSITGMSADELSGSGLLINGVESNASGSKVVSEKPSDDKIVVEDNRTNTKSESSSSESEKTEVVSVNDDNNAGGSNESAEVESEDSSTRVMLASTGAPVGAIAMSVATLIGAAGGAAAIRRKR